MNIEFAAPVGPRKFLCRRREELATLRFTRIGVEQLGATLGAEISGVDLRRPLDDETFAEIERALLAFKVLFFRDQDLSPPEHAAFGRRFGELEIHPFLPSPEGCPEVVPGPLPLAEEFDRLLGQPLDAALRELGLLARGSRDGTRDRGRRPALLTRGWSTHVWASTHGSSPASPSRSPRSNRPRRSPPIGPSHQGNSKACR